MFFGVSCKIVFAEINNGGKVDIEEKIDYKQYNKIVDRLNISEKIRVNDAKFLQVLLNICDESIIDKAVNLINKYGLNKAMKMAKKVSKNV